ncbi:MAG: hypothetical protein QGH76_05130 [Phycisphaerales bacterium]|nr:hypothetical protein [Phycisphaerales bacterium]
MWRMDAPRHTTPPLVWRGQRGDLWQATWIRFRGNGLRQKRNDRQELRFDG